MNDVTTTTSELQPPERNDQREQEEQVIDAVEDVEEAVLDEAQRRLVPAWIELHDARVAVDVEGAFPPAGHAETACTTLTRWPSRVRPGLIAKCDGVLLDRVAERARRACPRSQTKSVSTGSGGSSKWASARS